MRTTIHLDDHLLTAVKRLAAETHRTMTAVVSDALREVLARYRAKPRRKRRFKIITYGEGGLLPGVNLDNSSAVWDLHDRERYGPRGR